MKKIFSLLFILPSLMQAQNVGIGTTTPIARLHVVDSSVIFSAAAAFSLPASFSVPVSGHGSRLMWMPTMGAFRVGTSTGTDWNTDSIGFHSFAAGFRSRASGYYSVAMGANVSAPGLQAVALGAGNIASGLSSFAAGGSNDAIGDYSFSGGHDNSAIGSWSIAMGNSSSSLALRSIAMGYRDTASGNFAVAIGLGNKAIGIGSLALGYGNDAVAPYSTVAGAFNAATGTYSTALGANVVAKASYSVAFGSYNDTSTSLSSGGWLITDPLLTIGNGSADNARSNAFVVYKNGNTDINGYTQLGKSTEGAPAIKQKKITGIGPAVNGNLPVAHGLTASKILSVQIFMQYGISPSADKTLPPGYTLGAGNEYHFEIDGANILISNKIGNSANIGGKPYRMLITYEE